MFVVRAANGAQFIQCVHITMPLALHKMGVNGLVQDQIRGKAKSQQIIEIHPWASIIRHACLYGLDSQLQAGSTVSTQLPMKSKSSGKTAQTFNCPASPFQVKKSPPAIPCLNRVRR